MSTVSPGVLDNESIAAILALSSASRLDVLRLSSEPPFAGCAVVYRPGEPPLAVEYSRIVLRSGLRLAELEAGARRVRDALGERLLATMCCASPDPSEDADGRFCFHCGADLPALDVECDEGP